MQFRALPVRGWLGLVKVLLLLVCLVAVPALAAEPPRIFRKADGTICVISVDAGKIVETCEAAARPSAPPVVEAAPVSDAPRAEAEPVLTPSGSVSPDVVRLLGSASLKHGWSGGLKLVAISNVITGLAYLGIQGGGQAAAISLAAAGIGVAIALILDSSAASDLAAARGEPKE